MLVITRRAGQAVIIADEIEVVVLSVWGAKVRLGLDAPGAVPIWRAEIHRPGTASLPSRRSAA